MKTVMVVFSSVFIPRELAEFSLDYAAKNGAQLLLLDVLEKEVSGQTLRLSCDIGFLGRVVREKLEQEISDVQRQVISKKLCAIKSIADKIGIPVKIILIEGPYISSILEVARENSVNTIIAEKLVKEIGEKGYSVIDVKNKKED
ncbi:hypothetical protein JW877_08710 [bacterium]|nr:hypothetical protein [bacterium]